MRRSISIERPLRPLYSRFVRELVEVGSIAYSAVSQPLRLALRHAGNASSIVAVHMTRVSPNSARHEPWAFFMTSRVSVMGRSWSRARPSGLRCVKSCMRVSLLVNERLERI